MKQSSILARHRRTLVTTYRALALGGLALALWTACELANDGRRPLGERCSADSDCQPGLFCQYGRCRQPCT
jgi:hypothetical protein